ncbi:preprotein translocase subunit SecG [Candidatus Peregrinibacteria bacterium]|jgi:preprotein translocase subunit SecG|nr:preprotein translocase subunit SecG [Candidatus Peregrinibacteria bacterium]MBT7483746.1 preprotein translocase subunit SecG [Candidatus Peregrinibacteria bacterium]MBT7703813.1 preprotein translocase subunit SecG [Candidatus Peregrinibacteria bacterium]
MQLAIHILQITSAILLALVILIQSRGSGLSAAFGGSGEFYTTKRGAEKILATATVVIATLFIILSVVSTLIG